MASASAQGQKQVEALAARARGAGQEEEEEEEEEERARRGRMFSDVKAYIERFLADCSRSPLEFRCSVCLLYWYKSTNTDTKYKY